MYNLFRHSQLHLAALCDLDRDARQIVLARRYVFNLSERQEAVSDLSEDCMFAVQDCEEDTVGGSVDKIRAHA